MNADTTAAINAAATAFGESADRTNNQFIGQCLIGLATWAVLGAISSYVMSISVLVAMLVSITISLVAALTGKDEAIGRKARGFFSGFTAR